MINSIVQIVFAAIALVLGAAFEELLPKFFGVGVPILLTAVLFMSARRTGSFALVFAVAAGVLEDSLSFLPPMTSVSAFLTAAFLTRRLGWAWPFLVLVYPCYQIWLSVWVVGIGGEIFERVLLSCPIGLTTAFVIEMALDWLCRKAAVDERG